MLAKSSRLSPKERFDGGYPRNIPQFGRTNILARVLGPLLTAFQAELGEEWVKQIARKVLDDGARRGPGQLDPGLPATWWTTWPRDSPSSQREVPSMSRC